MGRVNETTDEQSHVSQSPVQRAELLISISIDWLIDIPCLLQVELCFGLREAALGARFIICLLYYYRAAQSQSHHRSVGVVV